MDIPIILSPWPFNRQNACVLLTFLVESFNQSLARNSSIMAASNCSFRHALVTWDVIDVVTLAYTPLHVKVPTSSYL